jgi:hypothetical protein
MWLSILAVSRGPNPYVLMWSPASTARPAYGQAIEPQETPLQMISTPLESNLYFAQIRKDKNSFLATLQ